MTSRDRCINRLLDREHGVYKPDFTPGQVVEDHTCCEFGECMHVRRVTLVAHCTSVPGWWQVDYQGNAEWVHETDCQDIEQQG